MGQLNIPSAERRTLWLLCSGPVRTPDSVRMGGEATAQTGKNLCVSTRLAPELQGACTLVCKHQARAALWLRHPPEGRSGCVSTRWLATVGSEPPVLAHSPGPKADPRLAGCRSGAAHNMQGGPGALRRPTADPTPALWAHQCASTQGGCVERPNRVLTP